MSKTPIVHHRPKVYRGKFSKSFWWSFCVCGHAQHYKSWHRALLDALKHSQELK